MSLLPVKREDFLVSVSDFLLIKQHPTSNIQHSIPASNPASPIRMRIQLKHLLATAFYNSDVSNHTCVFNARVQVQGRGRLVMHVLNPRGKKSVGSD